MSGAEHPKQPFRQGAPSAGFPLPKAASAETTGHSPRSNSSSSRSPAHSSAIRKGGENQPHPMPRRHCWKRWGKCWRKHWRKRPRKLPALGGQRRPKHGRFGHRPAAHSGCAILPRARRRSPRYAPESSRNRPDWFCRAARESEDFSDRGQAPFRAGPARRPHARSIPRPAPVRPVPRRRRAAGPDTETPYGTRADADRSGRGKGRAAKRVGTGSSPPFRRRNVRLAECGRSPRREAVCAVRYGARPDRGRFC